MKEILLFFATTCLVFNLINGSSLRVKREDGATSKPDKHSLSDHHDSDVKFWGYRKGILPKEWHKHSQSCKGNQQSPINIDTASTVYDQELKEILINKVTMNNKETNEKLNEYWTLNNNGHGVNLNPKNVNYEIKVDNETYRLLQMHFHWRGSEHFINNEKYVGELHLVHQNLNDSSKFTVIGVLYRLSNEDSEKLNPVVEQLKDLVQYKSESKSESISLDKIIPTRIDKYYRYPGSLTTPGCDEIVEWHVVASPILTISEDQLLEFQSLEDKHGHLLLTNSRPIQDINRRVVRRSFSNKNTPRIFQELSFSSANQITASLFKTIYSLLIFTAILFTKFNY